MKKTFKALLVFAFILAPIGTFTSCGSDDDDDDQPGTKYEDYVTPEVEEVLARFDFPMYEGNTPPNIEGTYYTDQMKVVQSDISWDDHLNKIVGNQKFSFTNQKQSKRSVEVSSIFTYTLPLYKGITETTIGQASFISGSGDSFTILYHTITENKTSDGKTYNSKTLQICSGTVEKGSDGKNTAIKNLQTIYMIVDDYGDPYNKLIPEYKARRSVSQDNASRITE